MKRFLLVLALVAVAGATYAATAPGSQTAGPTAKQFKALQKQVATLKKQVKAEQVDTADLGGFLLHCMAHGPVGVNSAGNASSGYLFGTPGTPPASATSTSALSLDTSGAPQYRFFAVNTADSQCATIINQAAGRHPAKRLWALPKH